MSTTQGEKGTFVARTDRLANDLGLSLRKLAPKIGLSVSSLFAFRSETRKISRQAWRKLEEAERTASEPRSRFVQETSPPSRFGEVVAPIGFGASPRPPPDRAACEQRLAEAIALAQQLPGGLAIVYSDLSTTVADLKRRLAAQDESE